MPDTLNWGILGTGSIARCFAESLPQSATGKLVAIASRTQEAADAFGARYDVPGRYGTYDALLADPAVQALYISTPHPMHAEWAIKAVGAGKHLLVEKPFTMTHAEAAAVADAARAARVVVSEAFMYRCHPQTARLVELLQSQAIGNVRVIQATFSFHAEFNPESRLYNHALGGGGILDVGCYTVSIARLIAGAAIGRDFDDPTDVTGAGHLGTTGVDEYAVGTLKFSSGIVASIACGVAVNQETGVKIFGTEGKITLPRPWVSAGAKPVEGLILMQKNGQPAQEITVPALEASYAYEADALAAAVLAGKADVAPPAMTLGDTLGNMRTLDRWRAAIGLQYPADRA